MNEIQIHSDAPGRSRPEQDRRSVSERLNMDPESVDRGLASLVLTVVELLRQLMERHRPRWSVSSGAPGRSGRPVVGEDRGDRDHTHDPRRTDDRASGALRTHAGRPQYRPRPARFIAAGGRSVKTWPRSSSERPNLSHCRSSHCRSRIGYARMTAGPEAILLVGRLRPLRPRPTKGTRGWPRRADRRACRVRR